MEGHPGASSTRTTYLEAAHGQIAEKTIVDTCENMRRKKVK